MALGLAQTDSVEQITIGRIVVEGNKKTKSQIIIRELSFKEGEQYLRYQFDSLFVWNRNRVYNTNLFNTVEFHLQEDVDGQADVLVVVEERWYFYPIPIFRLIDRNFNDWWSNRNRDLSRVNYGLSLIHFNFRGRAERLRVTGQFGFETRFNFGYRIPYIERTQRHGLSLNFNYTESKNMAFDTDTNLPVFLEGEELLQRVYRSSVSHSYRNSFYSFHFFSVGHTSVSIADTIATLNENYLSGAKSQKYWTLGYAYIWDKRNNRNYPTGGERYRASIQKYGLGIYNDIDFLSAEAGLFRYRTLGKKWYYAGNIVGLASFPARQSYFNYFAVGFQPNVLRGYDLYLIEGSRFLIQKNEVKKQLASRTYTLGSGTSLRQFRQFPVTLFGKVFFDHGYVGGYPNYDGSALLDDRYLYGYGLGIDFVIIYDVAIRLELSRNTLDETNFFIGFGTAL